MPAQLGTAGDAAKLNALKCHVPLIAVKEVKINRIRINFEKKNALLVCRNFDNQVV